MQRALRAELGADGEHDPYVDEEIALLEARLTGRRPEGARAPDRMCASPTERQRGGVDVRERAGGTWYPPPGYQEQRAAARVRRPAARPATRPRPAPYPGRPPSRPAGRRRRGCSAPRTSPARCRCGRWGSATSTTRRSASSASTPGRPSARRCWWPAVAMAIPVVVTSALTWTVGLSFDDPNGDFTQAEGLAAVTSVGSLVLGDVAAVARHDPGDRHDRPGHGRGGGRPAALARRGLGRDARQALAPGRADPADRAGVARRPRGVHRSAWVARGRGR